MVPASHSFRGPGDRSARRESRIHRFFPAGKRERCLPLPACFRNQLRMNRQTVVAALCGKAGGFVPQNDDNLVLHIYASVIVVSEFTRGSPITDKNESAGN